MSGFEIVGAVAAAGQFLEQGITVVRLVNKLRDQLQNDMFQQECQRLEEFNSFAAQIRSPRSKSLQTGDIAKVLVRGTQLTDQLAKIFEEITPEANAGLVERSWKAIGGLAREETIRDLFQKIESEKTSLISFMHIVSIHENELAFSSVNNKLESLRVTADPSSVEQKCLRELFVTDPTVDREGLLTSKGEIVQGTCEWIESHNEYQPWLNSEKGFLWIPGGPGKGKTMLSIYLSKRLEQIAAQQGHPERRDMVTYFFCDNKQQTRNNATSIIRGFLYHIFKQDVSLMGPLIELFKVQDRKVFEESSLETLWRVFLGVLRSLSPTTLYLVVDGLDECDPGSLEVLLKKLRLLYKDSSSVGTLKLIAISREYPKILPSLLRDIPRIRLDPDSTDQVNDGIRQYITTRVNELAETPYKNYSAELRHLVEETLLSRSNGTYLWVSFVVQDLEAKSASEVENCLEDLPRGLDEIYERMLAQIPPDKRDITRKILLWATFAQRPLFTEELADVLGVGASGLLTVSDIFRDYVRYCGHFLNVIEGKVTLVHQSAKDFLLLRQPNLQQAQYFNTIIQEQAHAEITKSCLAYLQSGCLLDEDGIESFCTFYTGFKWKAGSREVYIQQPFLFYAVRFWAVHARESRQEIVEIIGQNHEFFADRSPICHQLGLIYDRLPFTEWDSVRGEVSTIHFACTAGIVPWALKLLDTGIRQRLRRKGNVNQKNSRGETPLHCAVRAGHLAVVKLLVQYKAEVATLNKQGWTPLTVAILEQRHGIMRYLLENDANSNLRSSDEWTALHLACSLGDVESVNILVEAGATALVNDYILMAALRGGEIRVIRILLDHFSIEQIAGRNYLQESFDLFKAACRANPGASSLIRWLIEELGVDVHDRDHEGQTALHCVAREGSKPDAQFLIEEHGLNPNQETLNGETALHFAGQSCRDALQLIQYLIEERSMDPNRPNADGLTVLHFAASRRELRDVHYLIEQQRMNPEKEDHIGNTALHYAATNFRSAASEILQYLIDDKGMSPSHTNNFGQTALHLAISRRRQELARILLDQYHVDPRVNEDGKDTPLHEAMRELNDRMVEYLLDEYHLDPNIRGSGGKTPLHVLMSAKYHGFGTKTIENIIQDLVRHGADPNLKDDDGLTIRDYVLKNGVWYDALELLGMPPSSVKQDTRGNPLVGKMKRIMKLNLSTG